MFTTNEILEEFESYAPDENVAVSRWVAMKKATLAEYQRLRVALQPKKYKEYTERAVAKRRQRLAEDAVFRQTFYDSQRRWRAKVKGDPAVRKKRNEQQKRWRKANPEKMKAYHKRDTLKDKAKRQAIRGTEADRAAKDKRNAKARARRRAKTAAPSR